MGQRGGARAGSSIAFGLAEEVERVHDKTEDVEAPGMDEGRFQVGVDEEGFQVGVDEEGSHAGVDDEEFQAGVEEISDGLDMGFLPQDASDAV